MVAWINFRQGWRPLLWAGAAAVTALLLDFLPLFDVLGYDFAFALGLLVAVAAADLGHGAVSAARRHGRPVGTARLAGEAIAAALALLVLPLLFSLANALRVRNCNLGAGFLFFALLPVGTAIVAAGAGTALALLLPGRRWSRAAVLALPFLSLAWSLLRLYRDPAVFAFDPFGGYFPGPLYDEALRPPLGLLWFRLANLTWVGALLAVAHLLRPDTHARIRPGLRPLARPALVLVLLAGSLAWWHERGELGFHVTHDDLARVLPRVTRTQHFVLRTDPTAESEADLALLADDLEFRYHQLALILGVEPSGPIRVYRFPSAAAKKDAVGAAHTLFAKPWTREIFVNAERFPARRLRHELAHVFASAFGDRVFGLALAWRFWGPLPLPHLAMGLVEGLAEAADFGDPKGRSTLHQEAAAMLALGQAPDLARALGLGFTALSGPRAYTLAGSFCRFLLDRHGAAKLGALYRSAGDFPGVYGRDLAALEQDWRAFLAEQPVDEDTRAEAAEDFRRPAIFHKVCARELAARVAEARSRLGTSPASAVALLAATCADDPDEPTFRLDLAEAQIAAGEPERALASLVKARADRSLTRPLRNHAANLEAGIHFRAGRVEQARAALSEALATATQDADVRFAMARQRALDDPAAAATLGRVFFGDERGQSLDPALAVYLLAEFARGVPDDPLGHYLLGRQLATRDPQLAAGRLADACPTEDLGIGRPMEPIFVKECRRLLAESAYLAGELSAAGAAMLRLEQDARRAADRLRAQDFLERIRWKGNAATPSPTRGSNGTNTAHDRSQVPPRQ
jgi:hypothetical protein